MSKIYNCLSDVFSFASRIVRHPLTKKVTLTTYRVLKKLILIFAVALLEVAFLIVEKSAECAGTFVMVVLEETRGEENEST